MTGSKKSADGVRDVTNSSPVRAVSVSHELTTIQRAVEGAAVLIEIGRQGGLEGDDVGGFASAILALVACRIRDLGRACRGTLDTRVFSAPHNLPVEGHEAEDVILYPAAREPGKTSKRPARAAAS